MAHLQAATIWAHKQQQQQQQQQVQPPVQQQQQQQGVESGAGAMEVDQGGDAAAAAQLRGIARLLGLEEPPARCVVGRL